MSEDGRCLALEDIVEERRGKVTDQKDPDRPYVGLEHLAQGTPTLLGTAQSHTSKSTNSVFYSGDILFGKLRPNLRKCVQVDFDGYCSTDILVFFAKDGVLPGFAARVLQSDAVFDAAIHTSIGTRMPRTSWETLKNLQVFVPPLSEQRRIAAILDTVDEAIRQTEKLIAKLKQIKAGLLHDLLTRGLDEEGRLRDPVAHPEQFKETVLGRLPAAWDVVELQDIVDPDRPIVYGILKPGYGHPGGVPVVKVKDIVNGQIKQDDLLLTSPEIDFQYQRSRLREGDLLFTIRGTVGRTAFVPENLSGANITQDTARIGIVEARPRFVRYHLETSVPMAFFDLHTIGQAVQGINLRDLRRTPVVLPSLDEQDRIVEVLDAQVGRIGTEEAYRDKLTKLKQGLMQDLLAGRVRTTDMPSDIFKRTE